MSAEIFRIDLIPGVRINTKDTATNIKREDETFNKYVSPVSGAVWNEYCMAIHELHQNHKSVFSADLMAKV